MNKQNPKKIGWTDYTWNPVTGCRYGCNYCYMESFYKRMPDLHKRVPEFHRDRLQEPFEEKKPSLIFTVSAGDLWGDWVPKEWIKQVLDICRSTPQHIYQFLTKNPKRYKEFILPKNGWYGTTWDGLPKNFYNIDDLDRSVANNYLKFVSFEPLLKHPFHVCLDNINWIIIGGDTSSGAKKPIKEWAEWLISAAWLESIPVFIKDNYGYPEIIQEMPEIIK